MRMGRYTLKLSRLSFLPLIVVWVGYPYLVSAKEALFTTRFLVLDPPGDIDIRQFDRPHTLPEGTYKVDIYVNDRFVERREVLFSRKDEQAILRLASRI